MFRVIVSLALIALSGSVLVNTTRAWFTDKSTVANNTLASATLDFHLTGDLTESQSLNLTNLTPGQWTSDYLLNIYNDKSTVPIKYRLYDANASESVSGFYNLLQVKVVNQYCGGADFKTWTGRLTDLNWDSLTAPSTASQIDAGGLHCFRLSFSLNELAGNAYQNQNAKFDLVVDGTQVSNPAWSQ